VGKRWGLHVGYLISRQHLHAYGAILYSHYELSMQKSSPRRLQQKVACSARVASWDPKGLNKDAFVVLPGDAAVIAEL
jgi:hypothetical protein